jgi:hypothetical protein
MIVLCKDLQKVCLSLEVLLCSTSQKNVGHKDSIMAYLMDLRYLNQITPECLYPLATWQQTKNE